MTRPLNSRLEAHAIFSRLKAFKLLAQGKVRDSAPQPWVGERITYER
jgi:hypothetical protein